MARTLLKKVYQSVEEIDPFIGMVLESPVPGALIGKTIIFILGDQFARLKLGDRYFFDLQNQAGSFTIGIILTMVLTNLNVFKSLCSHYFCLKT